MTELEAVNILLSVIGEAPVISFPDEQRYSITDAGLARQTLAEVERDVQAEGWDWNTEYRVDFPRAHQSAVPIPSNVLKCQFYPTSEPSNRYVMRGLRIYDRQKHTFNIEADKVTADLVTYRLNWDELPHAAQQYMVIRAARIYSNRFLNSNAIYTYTAQDEAYARAMLIREEEGRAHNNMLWGNQRGGGMGMGYLPTEGMRHRTR